MSNFYRGLIGAALVGATTLSTSAVVHAADAVIDALSGGKVSGNFRLRFEDVDVDSKTLNGASALTLRSRLGFETAPLYGVTALLEFEDTRVVGGRDDYAPEDKNSKLPASNPYDRAAIVDPEQTEINRAYLRYRGVPKLDVAVGRQRINIDNQRFIGSVGWRQNEQTFDAFSAGYQGVPDWNFYYAYIERVKGIAHEKPLYNFDIDSSDNLFNIAYSGLTFGKLSAYGYFLNNQEPGTALRNVAPDVNDLNPALRYKSNDTYGLRFDGSYVLSISMPIKLLYTAEYAKQELTNPAGVEFDTHYSQLEAGAAYTAKSGVWSAKVAQEVLGSDDGKQGFQTPYATKHAFNGWVDMFLNTPLAGLQDRYATLAGDLQPLGVKVMLMYHQYSKDKGAGDFGDEWNAQVLKQFGPNYTLGVKYGSYRADKDVATLIGTTANIDTKKLWLW
ncbi:MAG TPA: alginate export family protein, partial [Spongiibacteraceae bacterium]|nr:alginate export family protein [Spongiibacteraceae bacterium]